MSAHAASQASAESGRTLKPAVRLTWLDLLIITVATLVTFALGQAVPPILTFVPDDPTPPLAVFEVRNGAVEARNSIAGLQARQTAVQDKIAAEYLDTALPRAPGQSSNSGGEEATPTATPQEILLSLQRESASVSKMQRHAQLVLADIQRTAEKQRKKEVSSRLWRDRAVLAGVSFTVLLCLILGVTVLRLLLKLPISSKLVFVATAMATILLLLSQIVSWIAAIGVATVILLLLLKGQRR